MPKKRRRTRPEGWVPRSQYRQQQRAAEFGVDQPYFTTAMKARVRKQFGYKCFICQSTRKLHIDHHIPLSLGKPLWYGNAVILCRSCNCSKGAKHPTAFYSVSQLTILSQMLAVQLTWPVANN